MIEAEQNRIDALIDWHSTDKVAALWGVHRSTAYTLLNKLHARGDVERERGKSLSVSYVWRKPRTWKDATAKPQIVSPFNWREYGRA